jgi:hypothetical protein
MTGVDHVDDNISVPLNATTASSWTPSGSCMNNNQPSLTPCPYIQGLGDNVPTFLTQVSGNEAGDYPDSNSDDGE